MDVLDSVVHDDAEDDYPDHPLMRLVTRDPAFRGGKPYIRDAGPTVRGILDMLANRWTVERILEDYPRATRDHIRAALLYGAWKAA